MLSAKRDEYFSKLFSFLQRLVSISNYLMERDSRVGGASCGGGYGGSHHP